MRVDPIPMKDLAELLQLQMDSGGRAQLVVTGNSMYPTLRNRRDAVYLVSVQRPLRRGDVILYRRRGGQYVLHRIVTKPKEGQFFCCGDNQWKKEAVDSTQVLALTDGFLRNGKIYTDHTWSYRTWVSFWIALMPVRRPLLRLRRCLGRMCKVKK